MAAQPRETDHDVLGIVGVDFKELAVIHHLRDHALDIVRLVGTVGDNGVERFIFTQRIIGALHEGRVFHIVLRDETHQSADEEHAVGFVLGHVMAHARNAAVYARTAQFLE